MLRIARVCLWQVLKGNWIELAFQKRHVMLNHKSWLLERTSSLRPEFVLCRPAKACNQELCYHTAQHFFENLCALFPSKPRLHELQIYLDVLQANCAYPFGMYIYLLLWLLIPLDVIYTCQLDMLHSQRNRSDTVCYYMQLYSCFTTNKVQ